MTITHTHIVGVDSNQNSVNIYFRPQGSDSAADPVMVHITPHAAYIHVSLSNAEFDTGANTQSLNIKPVN